VGKLFTPPEIATRLTAGGTTARGKDVLDPLNLGIIPQSLWAHVGTARVVPEEHLDAALEAVRPALFAGPVPTPRVYPFLRWLVHDARKFGSSATPETFPKQPSIQPGRYGNWLRLPGRHHSRDHWSRVWDGRQWLDGEAACQHILSLAGAPASLITEDLQDTPVRPAAVAAPSACPVPPTGTSVGGANRLVHGPPPKPAGGPGA
jgi:hypothetical protein